jgi:hypothetical protein
MNKVAQLTCQFSLSSVRPEAINTLLLGLQDETHASEASLLPNSSLKLTDPPTNARSLRHGNSLVIFDKQLHQLSTSTMKISKAPSLLKKAVTAFKIKTEVVHTKLLIMASLRRRMALVGAMSRGIRGLVLSGGREKQARVEYGDKALVLYKATAVTQEPAATAKHERDDMIGLSEVAIFDEDDHGYPHDWTHSMFNDDNCYNGGDRDGHDNHDDYGVIEALDEPSVIDIIRSNREVEGLEFNMDDDIDEACDMFIRRFWNQMNQSF